MYNLQLLMGVRGHFGRKTCMVAIISITYRMLYVSVHVGKIYNILL